MSIDFMWTVTCADAMILLDICRVIYIDTIYPHIIDSIIQRLTLGHKKAAGRKVGYVRLTLIYLL